MAATSGDAPGGVEPRVAFLNDVTRNQQIIAAKRYAENVIVTSKYTVISFVPKTIFEFFRIVANIYFLLISLLQLATPWSPTNRFTTAGPLVFVLCVTMLKQGMEDIKRHQADEKQNDRTCNIVNDRGQVEKIAWKHLQVGQVLLIRNHEELPADIVILATSEEEGRCFIETCNLDGETNLKRRIAVKPSAKLAGYRELNQPSLDESAVCAGVITLKGSAEYEQPNNQLYNFTGRLLLDNDASVTPLGPENIMLRGCGLRSCAFVVGLVIFTGAETKLLQNSRSAPSKQSKLYQTTNRCMLLIFTTMFSLCLVSAIVAAVWSSHNDQRVWYLPFVERNDAGDFVVNFFTFLILYNNLVPISLYVSLDIIKVLQARNITHDDAMMDDGFRAISRTSDLNEELGQVEYIFSDKTGTLTRNIMEFRKCSIGGVAYGFGTTEIGRAVAALQPTKAPKAAKLGSTSSDQDSRLELSIEGTEGVTTTTTLSTVSTSASTRGTKHDAAVSDPIAAQVHHDPSINFDDPRLLQHLYAGGEQAARIQEFLTLLSICHTVIPEVDKHTGAVTYRASSPDEEALVKAAKCLGYNFVDPAPLMKVEIARKNLVTGQLDAQAQRTAAFTIVNVNEFNSTRKRMSVVCVDAQTGEYVLYCKGADNMMLARAVKDAHTGAVLDHLRQFASEGLRTLVLGRRVLSASEYDAYNNAWLDASTSLDHREERLDAAAEMIERDMTIVGVTAIEDKLQEGVPQTIFDLAQAGIKIWVLTGDREETAINIGHACRLINDTMKLVYVNQEQLELLEQQIDELHAAPSVQQLLRDKQVADQLAMICDGKALVHVFPSKDALAQMPAEVAARRRVLAAKLLDVASVCKALIACRVSPSQKADIVNLVRKGSPSKPITLAIGDGANDVSMIQTAHVGVGICGKEGVQAVNASDYAIAQFRFLKRLVLIHGRFNYKRICKVIRYSFYKNISLVISLFLFNFYNGQSGAPLFESFVMAGWNFFLATPIIVIGVFDQDLPDAVVLQFPKLYRKGARDSDLNLRQFAQTIANAVMHALICFWTCWLCSSKTHGLFLGGTVFYSALLTTMKLKVLTLTLRWTKYHVLLLAFSMALYFFFLAVYPNMTFLSYDMFGVPAQMVQEPLYWHLFFMTPIAALLTDFTLTTAQQQLRPESEDILRERYLGKCNSGSSGKGGAAAAAGSKAQDILPDLGGSLQGLDDGTSSGRPQTALVLPRQSIGSTGGTMATSSTGRANSSHGNKADAVATIGFAFNGPERSRKSNGDARDMQELVTMRVMSFNTEVARRTESMQRTSASDSQAHSAP